jgi:Xaa-Pro aminopeptidase
MRSERKTKLKALMKSQGIDYLVLLIGPSFYYFTGLRMHLHERVTILFISSGSNDTIFLPKLEFPNASSILTEEYTYYTYTDEEGPDKALKSLSQDLGLDGKKIGIDFLGMRAMEYELLRRHAPRASFVNGEPIISEVRMRKDDEEISYFRRAVEITEKALKATTEMIRPGVSEQEVANALQIQMFSLGSGELWKQTVVLSGPRTAFPHSKSSKKVIEAGDLVMIDTGATYEGYVCDLTRTFAVGSIDNELRKIYEVVKEANEAVIKFSKPKFTAEELDQVARNVIEKHGYGKFFVHRTGHGLGLEGHEPPYIVKGNKMEMKIGMTFTDEPGIYLPNKGGVRIEDDLFVIKRGLESLTTYPRELMIL